MDSGYTGNITAQKKEQKTKADTMYGNILLPITHKEKVPNFLTLPVTAIMNKYYGKCKLYIIQENIW